MIVGAGFEQVPAIQKAREMGIYTIATDLNPDAIGFRYADKSYAVSTTDFHGTLESARKENIDGILTLISETAVPTVARITEELNLPGISAETAIAATNKNVMASRMKEFGVPTPVSRKITTPDDLLTAMEELKSPWVIKPSDSSGQRGIVTSGDKNFIQDHFKESIRYSTDKYAILEECVLGPEINVTTIVNNGEVEVVSLSHRVTLPSPHFGIAIKHIAPPPVSATELERVADVAKQSTMALKMKTGITYPQIIVTSEGPRLIEIAARIPGGNMREVALYSRGIDLIEVAILQALGEPFSIGQVTRHKAYNHVYVRLLTELDLDESIKKVSSVEGVEKCLAVPNIKMCDVRLKPGDQVPKLESSLGRFASLIAVGESFEMVNESMQICLNELKIR